MNLQSYSTIIFDCDGVVLDSNRIKTEAFRTAALPFGVDAAESLVRHHLANGGVSRYAKFAHFIEAILPQYPSLPGRDTPDSTQLLDAYAKEVSKGLMNCNVAKGLEDLRKATASARWLIISGGDQQELRQTFSARGIAPLFNAGIFGSPDDKHTILTREIALGNIVRPALFLGDSRYDYEVAAAAELDFIFIHGWTDLADWREFVSAREIASVAGLGDLTSAP